MSIFLKKKVLLRERKRHTARHVVSTHSVVLSWLTPPPPLTDLTPPPDLTPPGQTWPPQARPDPPGQTWPPQPDLTPPARLTYPPHTGWLTWTPRLTDLTPPAGWPPPCEQTNKVKLLPSRRTTYAGGNKEIKTKNNLMPEHQFTRIKFYICVVY